MKKFFILAAAFGMLAILVQPAAAMNHEVKIAEQDEIGKYLTDADGMTLYVFEKDSPGQSACTGGCVDNWPLFYREDVAPPEGVDSNDFGTITREDGAEQTTFRGYPLYYFTGDSEPGEAKGNGMMDLWHVVDPDSFPAE